MIPPRSCPSSLPSIHATPIAWCGMSWMAKPFIGVNSEGSPSFASALSMLALPSNCSALPAFCKNWSILQIGVKNTLDTTKKGTHSPTLAMGPAKWSLPLP